MVEQELENWIIWLAETIDSKNSSDVHSFKVVTKFNYFDVIKNKKYLKLIRKQKLYKLIKNGKNII